MPDHMHSEDSQFIDETVVKKPHTLLILIIGVLLGVLVVGSVYAGYWFVQKNTAMGLKNGPSSSDIGSISPDDTSSMNQLDIYTGPPVVSHLDIKEDDVGEYIELTPRRFYTSTEEEIATTTNRFYLPSVVEKYAMRIEWIEGPKERIDRSEFALFADYESLEFPYAGTDVPEPYIYRVGTLHSTGLLSGLPVYAFYNLVSGMGVQSAVHVLVFPNGNAERPIELLSETDAESEWLRYQAAPFDDIIFSYMLGMSLDSGPAEPRVPINTQDQLVFRQYYVPESGAFFNWTYPSGNTYGLTQMVSGTYSAIPSEAAMFSTAGKQFYELGGTYYLRLGDGRLALYERAPAFFDKTLGVEEKDLYVMGYRTPSIDWKKQVSDTIRFDYAGDVSASGCGLSVIRGTSDITNEDWFDESDLVPVAYQNSRPVLYEVATELRGDHPYYQSFFTNFAGIGRLYDEKTADTFASKIYKEYLEGTPLVFWKSETGAWHVFYNTEYLPAVECGKPVIYLYPEEATDVRVTVAPNGGFTYVEPEYPTDGWYVHANPDGTLYNYADDTTYPYLYWEGHANGFGYSEDGWIFATQDLEAELTNLLHNVGLNVQETKDFLEFWVPRMDDGAPYTFVTFARQSDFDRAAPLRISPVPDSVFRIFMYFEPRDTMSAVAPMRYVPFERHGFSVVEWGGVLAAHKK